MFASVACGPVRFGRVAKIVAIATSVSLLLAGPGWADQTTTAGTPKGSYSVLTGDQLSLADVTAGKTGTCGYQYNDLINNANLTGVVLSATGAAAAITGASAQVVLDDAQAATDGIKGGGLIDAAAGLAEAAVGVVTPL